MFDHVLAALTHGGGYERIATHGYSDRTIGRRLTDGEKQRGAGAGVLKAALDVYDQMIGSTSTTSRWTGRSPNHPVAMNCPAGPRSTAANKARNVDTATATRR